MVVHEFDCFCKDRYIGMMSRQLIISGREHVPNNKKSYCNSEERETKSTQILNALKRSSITENFLTIHFVHIIIIDNFKIWLETF